MGQASGAPTNRNGSHGGSGMGHTVFYRTGVVAVAAMVVALLVWPVASEAQLGDLTGTITGTTGTVTGTLLGTTTVLAVPGVVPAGPNRPFRTFRFYGSVWPFAAGEGVYT